MGSWPFPSQFFFMFFHILFVNFSYFFVNFSCIFIIFLSCFSHIFVIFFPVKISGNFHEIFVKKPYHSDRQILMCIRNSNENEFFISKIFVHVVYVYVFLLSFSRAPIFWLYIFFWCRQQDSVISAGNVDALWIEWNLLHCTLYHKRCRGFSFPQSSLSL